MEEEEEPDRDGTMPPPSGQPELIDSETSREAKISRLLAECDVFDRYGLKEKVIDQLKSVLELDPTHIPTRERLKELFAEISKLFSRQVSGAFLTVKIGETSLRSNRTASQKIG